MRRRSPIQTRKGAEEFERQLLREFGDDLAIGRDPFAGPPPTFAEFFPRWSREVATKQRPSTLRAYTQHSVNHLLPAFGACRIDQITSAAIDDLAARLVLAGRKPKTVNNVLSVLRSALGVAAHWGLLRSVPAFRWAAVPDPEWRALTQAEEQALVDSCTPGFWQTFVVFILHTGVRFSEAAAVTWDDLDAERPEPIVRICKGGANGRPGPTKTKSHREVPLDAVVATLLRQLPRTSKLIFPKPSGGMMDPAAKRKRLHRFCHAARIRPCAWHVLRHTFATRAAANGVPVPVLQKLLGHTTLEMTMRYIHVDSRTMHVATSIIQGTMAAPRAFVHQVSTNIANTVSRTL